MSSPPLPSPVEGEHLASQRDDSVIIPVLEENLDVGVRRVDTGRGVRVRTTVTQREEPLDVLLQVDEVEVLRVPVDRIVAADQAPASRQEGNTLVVPILEEILVVEKRVRIKEEVRITRRSREQHHVASVPLKSEHVSIERIEEGGDPAARARGGSPE